MISIPARTFTRIFGVEIDLTDVKFLPVIVMLIVLCCFVLAFIACVFTRLMKGESLLMSLANVLVPGYALQGEDLQEAADRQKEESDTNKKEENDTEETGEKTEEEKKKQ